MKFLLLFMFVAVALATEEDETIQHRMVDRLSTIFNITKAESSDCLKKTGVKNADMRYLEDSIDMRDSEITDKQSLKRASCTMVCAAQKQGTMIGRELNLPKMYDMIEEKGAPENIQNLMRDWSRVCKDEAQNEPDECMVGYRFLKCMYIRSLTLMEDK